MEHNIEQFSPGFYKQPRDANENALRLLWDRWIVLFTKGGRPGLALLKLDEKKAGTSWQTT